MFNEKLFIELPKPIKKRFYICGKYFIVDPILKLYKQSEQCGLIYINGDEYIIYTIDMTNSEGGWNQLERKTVKLPNDHNKGGQSAQRFDRKHKEAIHHYLEMASEALKKYFEHSTIPIVIAGVSMKKNQLFDHIPKYLQHRIIGTVTMLKTIEESKKTDIVKDLFLKEKQHQEEKLLKYFTQELDTGSNKAVYGKKHISKLMCKGLMKTIYLHPVSITPFLKNIAKKNGCTLIPIKYSSIAQKLLLEFGIVGLTWY